MRSLRILFSSVALVGIATSSLWSATVTVGDGESIRTAVEAADATDTIQIDSDGVFEEVLFLGATETGLTIEPAPGRSPIIEGNDGLNWEDSAPFPWGGILLYVSESMTFRDLHFRIDLSGMIPFIQDNPDPEGMPAQITQGYEIVRVNGDDKTVLFENCTFEYIGSIADADVLDQDTCTMSGTGSTTFNNCTWLYNHDLIEDPQANSFNTIQAFVPGAELEVNTVVINDGTFGALAHIGPRTGGGKGRSISTGGGGEGVLNMDVNDCTFGAFRNDYRQFQQAWAYPGGTNVNLTFNRCYFPDGCGRFLGGVGGLTVRYNGCTFHHSYGGQLLLPDPGGEGMIIATNCFFTWNSNTRPGEGEAIRGTNNVGYRFRHCTFVDLARENAQAFNNPDAVLMVIDNNINALEFTNCLFDVVGFSKHIVRNVAAPGQPPPVGLEASGNLIHSSVFPLTEGVLPPEAFAVQGDPMLAEDFLHLQAGSPAINAVTANGSDTDIDGESIPIATDQADIGADEFVAPGVVRPRRQVQYPGDVSSMEQALARAHGNLDEIVITSDGPFFERIRTDFFSGAPFFFTEVSSFIKISAADGTNPMLVVDGDTDWADEQAVRPIPTIAAASTVPSFATGVWTHNSMSFEGIHFRIDLTDMTVINVDDLDNSSVILVRVQARQGEYAFKDCIFEAFGNSVTPEVFGIRDMVQLNGALSASFDNCEWRYDMNLQSWPSFSNGLGMLIAQSGIDNNPVMRVDINDCVFQAVPDTRDPMGDIKARHIGSGGGPGTGIFTINNTVFGTDRDRFNVPDEGEGGGAGHLDGMVNEQAQQAQVSVAGSGITYTINDCTFLDGTDRQIGADTNIVASGLPLNRCIFEPTTIGSTILGDPGATGMVLNNSVVRYDSRHVGDGAPIRLWGEGGDRSVELVHCLLQDVAGVDGNPNTNVASMDDFSGISGELSSLVNCIVDAPAMAEGVFENITNPGELPINGDNPVVQGNVLNTGLLTAQIIDESGIVGRGDPALALDGYHLTECSLIAIDQISEVALSTDIDGDPRPSGNDVDAGPDEFKGTPESPENWSLTTVGACCLPDGTCTGSTEAQCDAAGGLYQGDATDCAAADCPSVGACCFEDGTCTDGTEAQCDTAGGAYQGDGTDCATTECPMGTPFRRGDHDGSGLADITDALNLLGFLFLGTTPPICLDASDFDNSGAADITDALILLGHLFLGSPNALPAPGTTVCGLDPDTPQPGIDPIPPQDAVTLGCEQYPSESFPGAACP